MLQGEASQALLTRNSIASRRLASGARFLSHLRSLGATMSQKSSRPQAAKSVSYITGADVGQLALSPLEWLKKIRDAAMLRLNVRHTVRLFRVGSRVTSALLSNASIDANSSQRLIGAARFCFVRKRPRMPSPTRRSGRRLGACALLELEVGVAENRQFNPPEGDLIRGQRIHGIDRDHDIGTDLD